MAGAPGLTRPQAGYPLARMKVLRFHRELYPGEAVDAAIKTFEPWARITREESPTHWVVQLSAGSAGAERRIAGELSNYALGLTVRRGPPGETGESGSSRAFEDPAPTPGPKDTSGRP